MPERRREVLRYNREIPPVINNGRYKSDTEFGTDGIGNSIGVMAHEGLGFGFDHHAAKCFRAAVADDDAA